MRQSRLTEGNSMVISTDRGRQAALTNLVSWQQQGGYGLPSDVLAAVGVLHMAQGLTVPDPPPLRHLADVAAHAVAMLARGEIVDPVKMAAAAEAARSTAARLDVARNLIALAIETAAQHAVAAATDAADRIIVDCLQPVYAAVLAQAVKVAPSLRGVDLDTGGWNVPPKVVEARNTLKALAERGQMLRQARNAIVGVAGQEPQHDGADQFLLMREPQNLVPEYSANRPLPPPDVPKEPAAALLWLVTEGEPGKPWLPTVAEQDQAWMLVFGEAMNMRQAASVSARATAGMHV